MNPPSGDAAEFHPLSLQTGPRFARGIRSARLELDPAQQDAVATLSQPARHGYYLWGPVGRGKTLLAERWFQAVPSRRTRRFHFHAFFRALHGEVFRGGGMPAALTRLFGTARVVLFDEFHAHDLADGMYLTHALQWLRAHDVFVIATSNYAPADLLPAPAFHETFAPAIALIDESFEVIGLGEGRDYRRRPPARALPARLVAPGARGFAGGGWTLVETSGPEAAGTVFLDADGLPLRARAISGGEAVLVFADLCERPVGAAQYLWLAASFSRVVVTGMPDPAELGRDAAARFANLVDVLHDRGTALHVVAAGRPERLLDAAEPPRDVARAVSRLLTLNTAPRE